MKIRKSTYGHFFHKEIIYTIVPFNNYYIYSLNEDKFKNNTIFYDCVYLNNLLLFFFKEVRHKYNKHCLEEEFKNEFYKYLNENKFFNEVFLDFKRQKLSQKNNEIIVKKEVTLFFDDDKAFGIEDEKIIKFFNIFLKFYNFIFQEYINYTLPTYKICNILQKFLNFLEFQSLSILNFYTPLQYIRNLQKCIFLLESLIEDELVIILNLKKIKGEEIISILRNLEIKKVINHNQYFEELENLSKIL